MKKTLLVLMLLCTATFAQDIIDNFNMAANDSLTYGNWRRLSSGGTLIASTDSTIVRKSGIVYGSAYWNKSFSRNQYAQFKKVVQTNGSIELYLCSNGSYTGARYILKCYFAADSMVIYQQDTRLVKFTKNIAVNDSVRFSCYGDSLFVHVNNIRVGAQYDVTYTSGYVGLGLSGDLTNKIDNFRGGRYFPIYFDDIVGTPAVISRQPVDTTIADLDTARFSIEATGSGLTYQWYRDGVAMTGETNSTLNFLTTTLYNKSKFYCELFTDTIVNSDTVVLTVNQIAPAHTGWPLEVLTWDVNKAYPGIQYNHRLGVKGGEYPYTFTLRTGPTGMSINNKTGEIIWTPDGASSGNSVIVKITDCKGDSLIHNFTIDATTTCFYFVDSATGSNSNDGSEAHPWLTMTYASATADSSKYIYVKKGTYSEKFTITSTNCGRFIAYPGDSVIVNEDASASTDAISIGSSNARLFQGFTFDATNHRWFFSVSGLVTNAIWRNNEMRNIFDTTAGNPSFIFFWDQGTTSYYNKMVVQDNVFHGLVDPVKYNGASMVMFNVRNMLYEDNIVYNMNGGGVNDKDDGRQNTFRHNTITGCVGGINLLTQNSQDSIEVCYNLITKCSKSIGVGAQLSYLKNTYIHHNTCIAPIAIAGSVLDSVTSDNVNIYRNVLGRGVAFPYLISIVSAGLYPKAFRSKVKIDSNVVFGKVNGDSTAGYGYYIPILNWSQWQDSGKDNNSLYMQLTLDSDSIPILPDSLKYEYGYLIPTDKPPAVITVQPQSQTKKSGETATFSVTATGTNLTYQWYGNDSLITGATSSTYSFTAAKIYNGTRVWCLLTTDTTISTDTAILTVTDMTIDQTIDSLILNIPSDPLFIGQQWYEHDTAITGATTLRFVVEADSAAYAKKNYYYCKVWNSVSDTIQSGMWQLGLQPSRTKQKRWFGFKTGAFIGAWR